MNFHRTALLLSTLALPLLFPGCVAPYPESSYGEHRPPPGDRFPADSDFRHDPRYREDSRYREDPRYREGLRHRDDPRYRQNPRYREDHRRPEIPQHREDPSLLIPGYKLVPGNGFAGPGYYYGPPFAPYYYEGRGVRFYRTRESAPRVYRNQ